MKRFDADLSGEELKEKILDAADKRFKAVGFKKTAMAEIANDLGMSTANLYRYFPSKVDIAEAFAIRCFVEKEQGLAQLLEKGRVSEVERLQAFGLALLHFNYKQLQEYPAINDIIVALCAEKPSLIERKRAGELELMKIILQKGQEVDGWVFDDINVTGRAILTSWIMFTTPTFMQLNTLEELESLLESVMNITINGLQPRT
ncbi:MAG TPA: TetR/AcrR family transcriptional regulator [Cycloclasticus sp.]|jgi:AcrR family transcriptional regulator|nr:TetR/AcrR family transcriptional regulator [Cycloclasticus sp.]HIL92462.1 TetR/AcrR family transcriptional regulator [Cycloclasticus sp.]